MTVAVVTLKEAISFSIDIVFVSRWGRRGEEVVLTLKLSSCRVWGQESPRAAAPNPLWVPDPTDNPLVWNHLPRSCVLISTVAVPGEPGVSHAPEVHSAP